ncbi:CDP-alcohol phosphatidyltransferase family protein [Blautia obeum]|uniref:CDP-alcohol phosphatidyltransferase family protein n=1 Tax=Blautia obeum TaxID=40520 RepID=UPI0032BF7BD7
MITPKDIENKTMNPAKRAEAKNSFFAFYIGRPISYVLTIPFLYTNISPNVVTIMSIICAFIGFGFLSFGTSAEHQLIGVLFIFLWNMGDGIDGNIARFKNIKSSRGDLLDTLGGYLALALIILGMGNAAYNVSDIVIISKSFPMIIAGLSAIFTLIPRLLMHRKIALSRNKESATSLKDKEHYSLAKVVALNICDPAGFQEVIMVIAILCNATLYFTIFYFLINLVTMLYSLMQLCD